MINQSNLSKLKECESSINIIDGLLMDIERDIINNTFQYYFNYMFDNFNIITFKNSKAINKAFYSGNINHLKLLLIGFRWELIKIIKFYRVN